MCFINAPHNGVARVHIFLCFALIVAALFVSVMPLAKLDVSAENAEQISSLFEEIDCEHVNDDLGDVTGTVDITALQLYKSVKLFTILYKASIQGSIDNIDESVKQEFKDCILNSDGTFNEEMRYPVVITSAIAVSLNDKVNDSGASIKNIVNLIVYIFAITTMISSVMFMPIVYAILSLVSVITLIRCISNPVDSEKRISGRLIGVLSTPLVLILLPCVEQSLSYGDAIPLILLLVAGTTAINVIFSHLHRWDGDSHRLINVTQFATLFSIGGYAMFFYNILSTGIFNALFNGKWSEVMSGSMDILNSSLYVYFADAAMITIAAVLVLVSKAYAVKTLKRISLAGRYADENMGVGCLALSIVTGVSLLLPFLMTRMTHVDPANGEIVAILELTVEQQIAFTAAVYGVAIMIASEILLFILKKIFCRD